MIYPLDRSCQWRLLNFQLCQFQWQVGDHSCGISTFPLNSNHFLYFSDHGMDYLGFRFWIGVWVSLALLIIVAFDLSALVRYITRFTEESFAMLIALIFIYEAFKKLFHILHEAPIAPFEEINTNIYDCVCASPNDTGTTRHR